MILRQLSPTGDFQFGNSALDFISNSPEAVAQVVGTSLKLWLGEWYLDTSLGCPWLEGVLGKHSQSTADITIQDYILGVQGVTDIASYVSGDNQDARAYTATVRLNTVYGLTEVQVASEPLF